MQGDIMGSSRGESKMGERVSSTTSLSTTTSSRRRDNTTVSSPGTILGVQRGAHTKSVHPMADYTNAGSPIDAVGSKEELSLLPNGMKMPTVKEILDCIPEHCKQRCIVRSSLNAVRDLVFVGLAIYFMLCLLPFLSKAPAIVRWIVWIIYAFVQGTFFTGIWVLGHECGHGAFSPWTLVNDIVGYVLHTPLLVPYFSWKFSHNKHHSYTNHLSWGETHVPSVLGEIGRTLDRMCHFIGEDAFAVYGVLSHFVFGWPMYILANATGGKRDWTGAPIPFYSCSTELAQSDKATTTKHTTNEQQHTTKGQETAVRSGGANSIDSGNNDCSSGGGCNGSGSSCSGSSCSYVSSVDEVKEEVSSGYSHVVFKGMNHFVGEASLVFPQGPVQSLVTFSGFGCLVVLLALAVWAKTAGLSCVICWYVGPYLVTNGYLVLYTWLQHTHTNIPHYGDDSFTWLRGALSTIDRPYPWVIDTLHHGIGTTHVLHHVDFKVPHYHAREATAHLQRFLGAMYRRDNTGIWKSVWTLCKVCHYVDNVSSVQYLKSYRDYQTLLQQPQHQQEVTGGGQLYCGEVSETTDPIRKRKPPSSDKNGPAAKDVFDVTESSTLRTTNKVMVEAGS
eukprot:GHVS01083742.1.p1 GENE.GHVS01083742.1~~GHVS01083742.1.p1  ORF type:complete len:616 (-),score=100.48 GHVS01083742.1:662-2509(-)